MLNVVINPGGISHMMQDNEGGYWISTLKSGLFYSSSLEIKQITVQDGLQENNTERLAYDRHGIIWGIHGEGKRSAINSGPHTIKTYPSLFTGGNYRVGQFEIIADTTWLMINPQGLHKIYGSQQKIYFPRIAITSTRTHSTPSSRSVRRSIFILTSSFVRSARTFHCSRCGRPSGSNLSLTSTVSPLVSVSPENSGNTT